MEIGHQAKKCNQTRATKEKQLSFQSLRIKKYKSNPTYKKRRNKAITKYYEKHKEKIKEKKRKKYHE